jgi:hypothetical protein
VHVLDLRRRLQFNHEYLASLGVGIVIPAP